MNEEEKSDVTQDLLTEVANKQQLIESAIQEQERLKAENKALLKAHLSNIGGEPKLVEALPTAKDLRDKLYKNANTANNGRIISNADTIRLGLEYRKARIAEDGIDPFGENGEIAAESFQSLVDNYGDDEQVFKMKLSNYLNKGAKGK
jgi:hypothetical protein